MVGLVVVEVDTPTSSTTVLGGSSVLSRTADGSCDVLVAVVVSVVFWDDDGRREVADFPRPWERARNSQYRLLCFRKRCSLRL